MQRINTAVVDSLFMWKDSVHSHPTPQSRRIQVAFLTVTRGISRYTPAYEPMPLTKATTLRPSTTKITIPMLTSWMKTAILTSNPLTQLQSPPALLIAVIPPGPRNQTRCTVMPCSSFLSDGTCRTSCLATRSDSSQNNLVSTGYVGGPQQHDDTTSR
jgi:hypothetical protein